MLFQHWAAWEMLGYLRLQSTALILMIFFNNINLIVNFLVSPWPELPEKLCESFLSCGFFPGQEGIMAS